MELKEKYLWIIFIILVIATSIYLRYYYQPQISLQVKISPTNLVYPYQTAKIPIYLTNTGAVTINNISLGIYINGNTTTTYKAYIPSGKQAEILYNFTPKNNQTYKISVVVDPNKLYNIIDRQSAQNSTTLIPLKPEKVEPYLNFPANPQGGQDLFLMNPKGYIATLYFDNFTKYFFLTGSTPVNNFIYPALDVLSPYINQIAVAHAYYSNYSLVSIWLKGYITPAAIDAAAQGRGINVTKQQNTSIINFGNSTTLCTRYSSGWTKILISINNNCTNYLKTSSDIITPNLLYHSLKNINNSILNYSGYTSNISFAGEITANSNALVFESLSLNGILGNICYGNILNLSNMSYCVQTLYQGNSILYQMNIQEGKYNISTWYIPTINTTTAAFNYAINLTGSYSFNWNKTKFISAYSNKCEFNNGFGCNNPAFASNATTMRILLNLTNQLNTSVTINKIGCVLIGNFTNQQINQKLVPGASISVHFPCYNNGIAINSSIIPTGIPLSIKLNYTANGVTNTMLGYAEILK